MSIKKIVITGPESTGKSTLCKQLADHFGCYWVPEYAREYLNTRGAGYTYEDLLVIAKGQIREEDKWIRKSEEAQIKAPLLFVDTSMYVMKVWAEYVFNDCHHYILNEIAARTYDLYLLCNIDLPWVEDELREHPDPMERKKIYRYYTDALVNETAQWKVVEGNYVERFETALEAVEKLLIS